MPDRPTDPTRGIARQARTHVQCGRTISWLRALCCIRRPEEVAVYALLMLLRSLGRTFMSAAASSSPTAPAVATLASGDRVTFREYGDENGYPVLFMHGNLNSREFQPSWEKTQAQTVEAGAHVYALDRPGYGGSSFSWDSRSYTNWAKTVNEFAKAKNLSSFAIVGYSSGGPHALACSIGTVENVSSLALVAGDGPYAHLNKIWSCDILSEAYLLDKSKGATTMTKELAMARCETNVAQMKSDYAHIKKENRKEIAMRDIDTAIEQGFDGPASDAVLECQDWGFEPSQVCVPTFLWHGEADESVPCKIATEYFMKTIPADMLKGATIIETENHTIIRRKWQSILEAVVQEGREASARAGKRKRGDDADATGTKL